MGKVCSIITSFSLASPLLLAACGASDELGSDVETPILEFGVAQSAGPQVASDGTDYLVTWVDGRDVYGARVTGNGTILDPGGFPIAATTESERTWAVVSNGSDYLVVYAVQPTDNPPTQHLYGRRVSADGTILDANPLDFGSLGGGFALASNGTDYMAAWSTPPPACPTCSSAIYVAKVTATGLAAPTPVATAQGSPFFFTASIASNGDDYLVGWATGVHVLDPGDGPEAVDLYVAHVSSTGIVQPPSVLPADPLGGVTLASNGSEYVAVWPDIRSTPKKWESDLYATPITASGMPSSRVPIVTEPGSQHRAAIASSGDGYVVMRNAAGHRISNVGEVQATLQLEPPGMYEGGGAIASNGDSYFVAWDQFASGRVHARLIAASCAPGSTLDSDATECVEDAP